MHLAYREQEAKEDDPAAKEEQIWLELTIAGTQEDKPSSHDHHKAQVSDALCQAQRDEADLAELLWNGAVMFHLLLVLEVMLVPWVDQR